LAEKKLGSFYKIAASLQQPATGFQHSAVKPSFQRARLSASADKRRASLPIWPGVRDFVEKGVVFAE